MSYNIACSTKTFILEIAPFLFLSVDVLCKFAILPVYCFIRKNTNKEFNCAYNQTKKYFCNPNLFSVLVSEQSFPN